MQSSVGKCWQQGTASAFGSRSPAAPGPPASLMIRTLSWECSREVGEGVKKEYPKPLEDRISHAWQEGPWGLPPCLPWKKPLILCFQLMVWKNQDKPWNQQETETWDDKVKRFGGPKAVIDIPALHVSVADLSWEPKSAPLKGAGRLCHSLQQQNKIS